MKQYNVTLTGTTPLIMHRDNLGFNESVKGWQKAPENKGNNVAGDDRSPPWTWIGYLYHNKNVLGIDSDCLMTCLREGGYKVRTGRRSETYMKAIQSGMMVDHTQLGFTVAGREIGVDWINSLIGKIDFGEHEEAVAEHDFELLVKRAKIGQSKHVRVRPLFRDWAATCSITVFDEQISGLTKSVLEMIFRQAGALCGLCDWRPSSPKPGSFGKFTPEITAI